MNAPVNHTSLQRAVRLSINCFRSARVRLSCTNKQDFLFFFCLLTLCITAALTGIVPTHIFGHDTFFLLDNSWRVLHDQRTHLDYASAWGPLTFIIIAAGMKLSHMTANGIGYGNALFGFLIGIWAYRLGRNRLQPFFSILASLFLASLVVAPYALSYGVLNSTHAMVYNRYGYAILGVIILESLRDKNILPDKNAELWFGISTGVALALSLFLKISYFLAALLLVTAISFICKNKDRRRFSGIVIGFCFISGIFLMYLQFDFFAMLNDLAMAATARSESLTNTVLIEKFFLNIHYLAAMIVMGLSCSKFDNSHGALRSNLQYLYLGCILYFADFFIIVTNQQWFELPLIVLYTIILYDAACQKGTLLPDKELFATARIRIVFSLVAAAIVVPLTCSQFISVIHGALEKAHPPDIKSLTQFSQTQLKPILLYEGETPTSNGRQYTTYVNEGVKLLLSETKSDETVLTIDMFNPFPFALGRRPPKGGIAAAAYQYTLNETSRPSDEAYFGDADIVMVPKKPSNNNSYFFGVLKIYEPGLHASYFLVTETDWWRLYRRRK